MSLTDTERLPSTSVIPRDLHLRLIRHRRERTANDPSINPNVCLNVNLLARLYVGKGPKGRVRSLLSGKVYSACGPQRSRF